jgi:hypothetical protein
MPNVSPKEAYFEPVVDEFMVRHVRIVLIDTDTPQVGKFFPGVASEVQEENDSSVRMVFINEVRRQF